MAIPDAFGYRCVEGTLGFFVTCCAFRATYDDAAMTVDLVEWHPDVLNYATIILLLGGCAFFLARRWPATIIPLLLVMVLVATPLLRNMWDLLYADMSPNMSSRIYRLIAFGSASIVVSFALALWGATRGHADR